VRGDEALQWEKSLSSIPSDVRISPFGWVVGIGKPFGPGTASALAIWNPQGELIADHTRASVLGMRPAASDGQSGNAEQYWNPGVTFEHDPYTNTYDFAVVHLNDPPADCKKSNGSKIVIDLRTGQIWPHSTLSPPGRGYDQKQHAISEGRAMSGGVFATSQPSVGKSSRVILYGREYLDGEDWELYVCDDGSALLRQTGNIRGPQVRRMAIDAAKVTAIQARFVEAKFTDLPDLISGADNDPHLRSVLIAVGTGYKGTTLFAPNRLSDPVKRKQAKRAIDCWLALRALFDTADVFDSREDVRSYVP
jgi:hypothetical protein